MEIGQSFKGDDMITSQTWLFHTAISCYLLADTHTCYKQVLSDIYRPGSFISLALDTDSSWLAYLS